MKIAIMGYGVVGSGVGEIISTSQESLKKRCGEDIEIASILDLRDFPDSRFKCFTKDFNDILNNDEIGLVVEVMGGTKPAYEFTKQLLLHGKHVVTSNKELVAKHGTELLKIAKDNNLNYLFEASVGGGIPIIRPLYSSLVSNELTDIIGILNGTTNYILTQMIKEGKSFETALAGAQENGYAEKDPTADVEGFDTCRKIAILTSLAFGKFVNSEDIQTEGITNITLEDVEYASEFGGVIKLVGMSERAENGAYARVCPVILKKDHPLAGIDDVFNGILVKGDALGDVMFYGRGAGSLPTASAVVSDVVDIIKHKHTHIVLGWTEGEPGYLLDADDQAFRMYVRISGSSDSAAFCREGFNVITLDGEKYANEFAIFTPKMTGKEFKKFKENELSNYDIKGSIRLVTD
ncbi:MAG: homoserine dehydrogenase [Eubacteriales bacterium]|jgi:homoserine dehydrogenase|nr:homoserine dehydrogenase [Clostridiales bacterium]MDD6915065.1 homoserine dehydrogenase [Eubacteriales bacterium]MDO5585890.1 homoserine dehydrogenase [Clostridia bacterium]MDY4213663.1 homoserine dehydrogenase [Eubacteriales bacterium]MDY5231240.1 homoserine dehydrogenase [Eubacteriales bacterium]